MTAAGTPVWVWAVGEWRPGRLLDHDRTAARVRYLGPADQVAELVVPHRRLWPSARTELVAALDIPAGSGPAPAGHATIDPGGTPDE